MGYFCTFDVIYVTSASKSPTFACSPIWYCNRSERPFAGVWMFEPATSPLLSTIITCHHWCGFPIRRYRSGFGVNGPVDRWGVGSISLVGLNRIGKMNTTNELLTPI